MSFIESYKHLEKLCGEILGDDRRISAYIDEMLNTARGSYLVPGWDNDLKQLKHYRWVRNQIAHEPNCTESNMCEPEDAEWLNDFYSRIMNQTDPLALYAKAIKPRQTQRENQTPKVYANTYTQADYRNTKQSQKSGCLLPTFAILAVAMLMALIYIVLRYS